MSAWQIVVAILASAFALCFVMLVLVAIRKPTRAKQIIQMFTRGYEHVEAARHGRELKHDLANTISEPMRPVLPPRHLQRRAESKPRAPQPSHKPKRPE